MIIAIDFDGTCVSHEFPNIGKDIGAEPVLKELIANGHQLILFTMRSDISHPKSNDYNIESVGGNYLSEAVNWFENRGIPLFGINKNPTQRKWTKSPKAYAQLYIDDAALGCPLSFNTAVSTRPFVNWNAIRSILALNGLLK